MDGSHTVPAAADWAKAVFWAEVSSFKKQRMGGLRPLGFNEELGACFYMMAFDLIPALEIGQGNVETSADTGEIISAANGVVAGFVAFVSGDFAMSLGLAAFPSTACGFCTG
jgi:hypothetical protein